MSSPRRTATEDYCANPSSISQLDPSSLFLPQQQRRRPNESQEMETRHRRCTASRKCFAEVLRTRWRSTRRVVRSGARKRWDGMRVVCTVCSSVVYEGNELQNTTSSSHVISTGVFPSIISCPIVWVSRCRRRRYCRCRPPHFSTRSLVSALWQNRTCHSKFPIPHHQDH